MKEQKNWEKWRGFVSTDEIEKLMQFIHKWDSSFRSKTPTKSAEIYNKFLPLSRNYT